MSFFAVETVVTPVCYDDAERLARASDNYHQKALVDAEKGQLKASEMRRGVAEHFRVLAAQVGSLAIEAPDEQKTPVSFLEIAWSERVMLHRSRVEHIRNIS